MTAPVVEHFFLVDRITCPCGGPVIISPVFGSDSDRLAAVGRHGRSPEHRVLAAYYRRQETPLTSSVSASRRSRLTSGGATSDREERVSSPPSRGGVSETR